MKFNDLITEESQEHQTKSASLSNANSRLTIETEKIQVKSSSSSSVSSKSSSKSSSPSTKLLINTDQEHIIQITDDNLDANLLLSENNSSTLIVDRNNAAEIIDRLIEVGNNLCSSSSSHSTSTETPLNENELNLLNFSKFNLASNFASTNSSSSSSSSSTSSASTISANGFQIEEEVIRPLIDTNTSAANNDNSTKSTSSSNRRVLRERELKAVDEFLKIQKWESSDAKSWNIAVKFLMARKFDVERAIKLYNEHEVLRKKEGLDLIHLNDEKFNKELESGKFTILPFLKSYPVFALFTVRLHNTSSNELSTLQSLIYQLDAVLENPDAQRNGIIFIYDMNNCKKSNYDLNLSQKILMLVRGAYPARLNKVLVVAAPFWFKCVVKVLSILLREKMRERVLFVTNEELKNQVPLHLIPEHLGGLHKLNHSGWLVECNKLILNKASTSRAFYFDSKDNNSSELISSNTVITSDEPSSTSSNTQATSTSRKRASEVKEEKSTKKRELEITNSSFEHIQPLSLPEYYKSLHVSNSNGMRIEEVFEHVQSQGQYGLNDEFKSLKAAQSMSSYDEFKKRENVYKNRYRDVICLDESRVKLKLQHTDNVITESSPSTNNDYIHANFVDGFKQKNAYISTQGPLDETVEEFWRMIWQETVLVIAMTTKVIEMRKIKCAQYWPLEKGECFQIEHLFDIKNEDVEDLDDYRVTKLSIKHLPSGQTRNIVHCQFMSWPDHGVPKTASHILDFIELVRKNQKECMKQLQTSWQAHPNGPPICVHCSAGIGRTGTFCTIDICINRLDDCKNINIFDTVQKIRYQRAQSVQTHEQYVFCYLAALEYAQKQNLFNIKSANLAQLFENLI